MLVVHLLDPQKDENILDACSAPGGKAAHMAERMENRGRILPGIFTPGVDLRRNVQRMRLPLLNRSNRMRQFQAVLEERFDRVLIDALQRMGSYL